MGGSAAPNVTVGYARLVESPDVVTGWNIDAILRRRPASPSK
jgi:hypothetical protein